MVSDTDFRSLSVFFRKRSGIQCVPWLFKAKPKSKYLFIQIIFDHAGKRLFRLFGKARQHLTTYYILPKPTM